MKTVRTKKDETWDLIAYNYFGDEMILDNLLEANARLHDDVITFEDGDYINIPGLVVIETTILPSPWS